MQVVQQTSRLKRAQVVHVPVKVVRMSLTLIQMFILILIHF